MKGIFYAVGVGSGNPLELTLHAKQILEQADVIVTPVKHANADSVAFAIAQQVADMRKAETLKIVFPMKPSRDYKNDLRSGVLFPIIEYLKSGKMVAMITLGDVSVYSTASYVREIIAESGYQTSVIPGISSFSAGAAAAQLSLCENQESLLILPAVQSPESVQQAILQADNIIMMKAGNALHWLIPMLEESELLDHTVMMQNIGMPDAYIGKPVIREKSYFTTLLIKKGSLES
ncbi:MAG: precorrin-2 C(20)-methyltransferase [Oscillospiraceae bacterium]|nr:precorrin-2 C(20)-methyltransferase [Oscillospiraceae bacterium]